ncbi:hypothetical protein ZWY2020_003394 [Hordeum vulgare]|nr:hypothetical protein ZWY2020_003394 [Hordeum vulgare]
MRDAVLLRCDATITMVGHAAGSTSYGSSSVRNVAGGYFPAPTATAKQRRAPVPSGNGGKSDGGGYFGAEAAVVLALMTAALLVLPLLLPPLPPPPPLFLLVPVAILAVLLLLVLLPSDARALRVAPSYL